MPNAESSELSDWPDPLANSVPPASAWPDSFEQTEADVLQGLSDSEVQRRWAAGLGNDAPLQSSRSYAQIVRVNLFAFINFVFFGIGVVMVALGRAGDAILVTVAIGSGVALNIIQEIAAKRKLDRIALLTRPTATVVRSGRERSIDPAQIVQGDVLRVRSGDQILVDGTVAGAGLITVDESLLTGESEPVPKTAGDRLYSGTVCTSGTAAMVAEQVGQHSVAYRLAQSARQFRQMYTPLQGEINLVIRIFTLLACFLWILVGISVLSRVESLEESVQRAAVIAGLVPSGLYLTITLSYALGAVKMVGEQVLIQQVNAVESLSNVDVLCLDKTGTLTANRMQLEQVIPLGEDSNFGNLNPGNLNPDPPYDDYPDAHLPSAHLLSANNLNTDSNGNPLNTNSNAENLSTEHLSAEHLSAEHLSAEHLSAEHLSAEHLSTESLRAEHLSTTNPNAENPNADFNDNHLNAENPDDDFNGGHLNAENPNVENPNVDHPQADLEAHWIALTPEQLRDRLGTIARSTQAPNATSEAIAAAGGGSVRSPLYEIPFASGRKWSAIAFAPPEPRSSLRPHEPGARIEPGAAEAADWGGLYVLGAPEMILPQVGRSLTATEEHPWHQATRQGFRVLLLAHSLTVPSPPPLDQPTLPTPLQPLAWVILSDELRPQVRETLAGFAAAGIAVKVISGDSPDTVAAVATQAGLGDRPAALAGADLDGMSDEQLLVAVTQTTVFGRVTPAQKERLVGALRDRGHYVAMVGDGVNDVLSLKRANLGIAMEGGSKATRSAADIVLLGDSFTALPLTFLEGQRIRNAIRDVLKLFLVRVFCVTILILCTGQVLGTFPMQNKHSAIVTILGVGLPTFGFPIWAKPGKSGDRGVLRSILHFTIPATLSLSLVSLAVYFTSLVTTIQILSAQSGGYVTLDATTLATPRSALVTVLLMCQLMLVPFLKPPTRAWVGGESLSGDWRYTWVAAGLIVAYFGVLLVPASRNFFELVWLGWGQYGSITLVSIGWAMVLRYSWRSRLIDRFLGVNLSRSGQP